MYPENREEFNAVIESIKEGTYKGEALSLINKGLTDEDAAELCEAMRVATEAGICNITQLFLANNQLTTLDVKGLTQLEMLDLSHNQLTTFNAKGLNQLEALFIASNQLITINNIEELTQLKALSLFNNQLTTLTRAKLSSLFPANLLNKLRSRTNLFNKLRSRIIKLTPEEQTKVNNEFNEKVDWAIQQYLNGKELNALESELKSNLKKEGEDLLLTPEDSIYIMSEINQFNQCATDDTLLFFFPSNIKEGIIQHMCLDSQNENTSDSLHQQRRTPSLP